MRVKARPGVKSRKIKTRKHHVVLPGRKTQPTPKSRVKLSRPVVSPRVIKTKSLRTPIVKPPEPVRPQRRFGKPARKKVTQSKTKDFFRSKNPVSTRIGKRDKLLSHYKERIRGMKNVGQGRFLVMLACGPSVKHADINKFTGHPKIDAMTINKPNYDLWPTRYWAFCDQSQFNRNKDEFRRYKGVLINASAVKERKQNQVLVRNLHGKGFSSDLVNGFYIGRSTTYANLQTALWMGYDKIFIFGCDMGRVDGQLHHYGKNPDVKESIRESRFANEAKNYQYAASHLPEPVRKKVFFCSKYNNWPFVKAFNKMDEVEAVNAILALAEEL